MPHVQHAREILAQMKDSPTLGHDVFFLNTLLDQSPTPQGQENVAEDIIDACHLGTYVEEGIKEIAQFYNASLLFPSNLSV